MARLAPQRSHPSVERGAQERDGTDVRGDSSSSFGEARDCSSFGWRRREGIPRSRLDPRQRRVYGHAGATSCRSNIRGAPTHLTFRTGRLSPARRYHPSCARPRQQSEGTALYAGSLRPWRVLVRIAGFDVQKRSKGEVHAGCSASHSAAPLATRSVGYGQAVGTAATATSGSRRMPIRLPRRFL